MKAKNSIPGLCFAELYALLKVMWDVSILRQVLSVAFRALTPSCLNSFESIVL